LGLMGCVIMLLGLENRLVTEASEQPATGARARRHDQHAPLPEITARGVARRILMSVQTE
jgi:hypothetical protein